MAVKIPCITIRTPELPVWRKGHCSACPGDHHSKFDSLATALSPSIHPSYLIGAVEQASLPLVYRVQVFSDHLHIKLGPDFPLPRRLALPARRGKYP